MKYRIQWDYQKAQTYRGNAFGPRNEGVIIEADNARQAFELFNAPRLPGAQFNCFYLKATEIKAQA